jgi:energy-coupling factor transporter ATP-binding protein EcfA2
LPNADRLIVGISGLSGSGKSTTARSLAELLGGDIAAFGDYVRHLAQERGASIERWTLQEIGEAEVRANVGEFVEGFLAWAGPRPDRALIVDGVRHVAVDTALRAWARHGGRTYIRMHIAASDELRASRRTSGDESALALIDSHPVEQEAATRLLTDADLVVNDDRDAASVLADVLDLAATALGTASTD